MLERSVWDVSGPSATAVRVYGAGADFVAVACAFDLQSSEVTDVGQARIGTPGGTNHGAALSSGTLQIPAGAATSGAWQTGAQRWAWPLADLGLTFETVVRWAMLQVSGTSFSDGGEARSGEAGWGLYLGTAETTAVFAAGVGRPAGSAGSYAASQWATSSTAFNFGTAAANRRGATSFARVHDSSTGSLFSSGLNASGSMPGTAASGSALTAAPVTHLVVWAGRRGGTPSAFHTVSPQGLMVMLPGIQG